VGCWIGTPVFAGAWVCAGELLLVPGFALLLGVFEMVWPWKALAAISASPPDSATTPAATQRVTAEIRRRPASRAIMARRVAVSSGCGRERRTGGLTPPPQMV
jgi:hypothetical protein